MGHGPVTTARARQRLHHLSAALNPAAQPQPAQPAGSDGQLLVHFLLELLLNLGIQIPFQPPSAHITDTFERQHQVVIGRGFLFILCNGSNQFAGAFFIQHAEEASLQQDHLAPPGLVRMRQGAGDVILAQSHRNRRQIFLKGQV